MKHLFVVLLKFADRNDRAGALMEAHNDWIRRGFDERVFLLSGSLPPALGGAILAADTSRAELERRLQADPLVAEGVVSAEIIEIAPKKADPRLDFLA